MPRFVVLLRGVNLGGGNRIAMAEFRCLLEESGFTEVRTLLNSGNAVFASSGRASAAHARTIAAAMKDGLGLSVAVTVRSASEFGEILAANPFDLPTQKHSRLLVAFALEPAALAQLADLAPSVEAPERMVIGDHAAYLHCARGILDSRVASALLGKASRGVTTRNWATVLRLGDLLGVRAASRRARLHPTAKEG